MRSFSLISWFAVAVLVTAVQAAERPKRGVNLAGVPKPVAQTLRLEARGGKVVEVEKEVDEGTTIYEAEWLFEGREYEIAIAEDGTLLGKVLESEQAEDEDEARGDDEEDDEKEAKDDEDEEEEQAVKKSDLPKAVLKTLTREARGGEIEEIEKEQEGGRTVYEAEVEIGGKEYEIEIAEDGVLLSKTLEKAEMKQGKGKDDDEDEDDDEEEEDEDEDDD